MSRYTTSWHRLAAFTLVEVLAGVVLLGGLVVGVLSARSQLTLQSRQAADRVEACQCLDRQLMTWQQQGEQVPRNAQGAIADMSGWSWRTRAVENESAAKLGLDVLVVEVFAPGKASAPAAAVEIALIKPDSAPRPGDTQPASAPADRL